MNGAQTARQPRPVPAGPTPPAPAAAPPVPPNNAHTQAATRQPNGSTANGSGTHPPSAVQKGKKKAADPPVDPSQMYETLKNRIAALEEEEVHEEEEERRFSKPHFVRFLLRTPCLTRSLKPKRPRTPLTECPRMQFMPNTSNL